MIRRLLIANRGEIACRIIRSARKLGIFTIAVYSDPDQDAQHVLLAHEAYYLGPAPSAESYLAIEKILQIAKTAAADAIHPGYGFLSENPDFARACAQQGILFIGPSPDAIEKMADKNQAKQLMAAADIPVTPGFFCSDLSEEQLAQQAQQLGYPLLLKAVAGGGGKGMRLVEKPEQLQVALAAAQREAKKSFADDRIIAEKYITAPRHVEVQIFADSQGNCVYLFERDCSIQRRHQKIIEEAPAPGLEPALREQLGKTAVAAAKNINYLGAGTIEFLLDQDNQFYFMEMNTRLQVEHPVTEMITGQDLVLWQLKVAEGEPLPLSQEALHIHGHSIEVRLYAEDPNSDFLPAIGCLQHLKFPEQTSQLRIDSGFAEGDEISPFYDPMLAKVIAWGSDRLEAIRYLSTALAEIELVGLKTNLLFLQRVLNHSAFISAALSTNFIATHQQSLLEPQSVSEQEMLALASFYVLQQQQRLSEKESIANSPWAQNNGWRANLKSRVRVNFLLANEKVDCFCHYHSQGVSITVQEKTFQLAGSLTGNNCLNLTLDNKKFQITVVQQGNDITLLGREFHYCLSLQQASLVATENQTKPGQLTAPMPGTVISVQVKTDAEVAFGDPLVIIEAMKMEHTITAPHAGKVKAIFFNPGAQVKEGDKLIELVEN